MIKKIIPLFVIFSTDIFFSLSTLFNYNYDGKESSSIYIFYSITIFILGMLLFLEDIIVKKKRYNFRQILLIGLPCFIFLLFAKTLFLSQGSLFAQQYFVYYILWGVPALLMGIYISREERLAGMSKLIDILMIVLTLAVVTSSIDVLLKGTAFISLGGSTYQTASYISALVFGINLYFLMNGDQHIRFNFTQSKLYKLISFCLLILQVLCVFITGGRGGLVLIVIYTFLAFVYFIKKDNKISTIFKLLMIVFFIIIAISLFLPELLKIPSFNNSFYRVFSYLSSDGINWTETSYRDIAYKEALELIRKSPLAGYGYYGIWRVSGYPHNVFLEVLLQGGIIYLMFAIVIIALAIKRLVLITKKQKYTLIISFIALYPLIMLMFSGTYTTNSVLWFTFSFIFSYDIQDK